MPLTDWTELIAVGTVAGILATIVARGKDLFLLVEWMKSFYLWHSRRRVKYRLLMLEAGWWSQFQVAGLARWMTGEISKGQFGAVKVTPELCKIVGLPESEVLKNGWMSALHPKYRDDTLKTWDRAMADGTGFTHKWAFLHKNGKVVYVYGEFHPIYDRHGRFSGGIGGLTVITRKDVEELTDA